MGAAKVRHRPRLWEPRHMLIQGKDRLVRFPRILERKWHLSRNFQDEEQVTRQRTGKSIWDRKDTDKGMAGRGLPWGSVRAETPWGTGLGLSHVWGESPQR